MTDIYNLIGFAGISLSIFCYARVQWQRDYAKKLSFSLLNLMGSLLFAISFVKHWNFPSFINNTIWGLISLYGVYRCLKYMRRGKVIEARLKRKTKSKT